MKIDVETDFLVVGAGPAGAALGCFLGQNGVKTIVISSSAGTADTPRAHIVNPFALGQFHFEPYPYLVTHTFADRDAFSMM